MPRTELFDAAVNRALVYALRLGLPLSDREKDREKLRGGLELWYLKTRFAYRIPLETVVATLQDHPGGDHYWRGGKTGSWVADQD